MHYLVGSWEEAPPPGYTQFPYSFCRPPFPPWVRVPHGGSHPLDSTTNRESGGCKASIECGSCANGESGLPPSLCAQIFCERGGIRFIATLPHLSFAKFQFSKMGQAQVHASIGQSLARTHRNKKFGSSKFYPAFLSIKTSSLQAPSQQSPCFCVS